MGGIEGSGQFDNTYAQIELIEEEISEGRIPDKTMLNGLLDNLYNDILGKGYVSKHGPFVRNKELVDDGSYEYRCLSRFIPLQDMFVRFRARDTDGSAREKIKQMITDTMSVDPLEKVRNRASEGLTILSAVRILAENVVAIFDNMLKVVYAATQLMFEPLGQEEKEAHKKTAERFVSVSGLLRNRNGEMVADIKVIRNCIKYDKGTADENGITFQPPGLEGRKIRLTKDELFEWQYHTIRKVCALRLAVFIWDFTSD